MCHAISGEHAYKGGNAEKQQGIDELNRNPCADMPGGQNKGNMRISQPAEQD